MAYGDPKHSVINPNPSVDECVKSLRFKDYMTMIGITSGSWGYGYIFGKPARFASANCAATIGFTFASLVCLQDTRSRFMGLLENEREVKALKK